MDQLADRPASFWKRRLHHGPTEHHTHDTPGSLDQAFSFPTTGGVSHRAPQKTRTSKSISWMGVNGCPPVGHGQKALEENVHHTPSAVNIIPEAVRGGDGPQVRPVPHEGGSCPSEPMQRGMVGEGGDGLQPQPPISRWPIAQPTALRFTEVGRQHRLAVSRDDGAHWGVLPGLEADARLNKRPHQAFLWRSWWTSPTALTSTGRGPKGEGSREGGPKRA